MIQSFRRLIAWQKAMDLVELVYCSAEKFPKSETYGLISQLRRAAVSIPSNIAEGKAIGGQSYPRHLRIALGSRAELETQIELARRLRLLSEAEAVPVLESIAEVGRLVAGLLKSLPRD